MRRKLFAANWKMNLTPAEGRTLIGAIRAELDRDAAVLARDREVMIAPPVTSLSAAAQALAGSSIALGAQNMYFEPRGAFTGEVSAEMLRFFGVSYVIVGHSERRYIFHENDEMVGRRAAAVAAAKMTPILCVGETAAERDGGHTVEVVLRQLQQGLGNLSHVDAHGLVIAYEPLWAIGTGRTATPEQAQGVHGAIREAVSDRMGHDAGATVRILYGGSVTAENVDSLMAKPDIDGALVGGASLKADSFARIVRAKST
ncbi:MAG TPA: triose-phosphate isomerase [Candidatus Binataceae bacterium]|jgi:triosephosphate isomerase|nr:triose-phosphate isomerase [Candidatus Binataceae bacterium]